MVSVVGHHDPVRAYLGRAAGVLDGEDYSNATTVFGRPMAARIPRNHRNGKGFRAPDEAPIKTYARRLRSGKGLHPFSPK
ncbi:hypothetical protein AORI_1474 [Amycolatopsis keratiniphila]|uniref:Uncharacterized protein n=1 Tax=Amycolatopsis keratiniphila TaxID=129921 RepID=R4SZ70_9PSEU|nr:hypothetical protein AORI_1474 [Amycolatopsis keratiniphila]